MNKFVKRRIKLFCLSSFLIISGVFLILYVLEDKITFFYTPSKITSNLSQKEIRLGGFVKNGSIKTIEINKISFVVTDFHKEISVYYEGAVPQLFRDGQGVVVTGKMTQDNEFLAKKLFTKHDEKYQPPN